MGVVVLFHIDQDKYKKYIKEILMGSAKDILELGLAGHASEISSASIQRGEACLAQAWSTATFVELVTELFPESDLND